jgi:putative transposase
VYSTNGFSVFHLFSPLFHWYHFILFRVFLQYFLLILVVKIYTLILTRSKIYTSTSFEDAKIRLDEFKEKWKEYKRIIKKAEDFMEYLEPLFELPQEIRKCIYTSNAVESVNSALRKVTRGKGAFPNENSVYKVMYLRLKELSEKWKKPIPNWKTIQPQLIELFGERYIKHLEI